MSQPVVIVPNIRFGKNRTRRIYLEKFNFIDKEAETDAIALSQIMQERIFNKKAETEPEIKIVTPL